jgi:PBSX family phage terminase large subunit
MSVELFPYQYKFIKCDKPYTLISAGLGSGKSFAGACWAITMLGQYPKSSGGIFANTYKQLRNATLKTFFKLLEQYSIPYSFNKNESIIKIYKTTIYCYSLDNYDAIRGIEIGWAWVDEGAFAHEEAWEVLAARTRDKNGPCQIKITTTPNGFNWLYRVFIENQNEYKEVFKASTFDNTYLPKEYAKRLESTYDENLQKQELYGEFINLTSGKIYPAFNRDKCIVKSSRLIDIPLMGGVDFNVNPLTGVIGYFVNNKIVVIDEIFITSTKAVFTEDLAQTIKSRYGTMTLIPDATGKALKTSSAGVSDHDILKSYGFTIPDVRNPFRRDRYNLVNKMLEEGRLIIDPKCVNLIKDLEQLSYKEGSDLPDLSNKDLGHISDALGYLCWYCSNRDTKPSLRTQKLF